ncbi:hypothetical protein ACET3Z_004229 [Daucus carota]
MNPAYNFNSSASSFRFSDLNEDHIPEYQQYASTTNHSALLQQATATSSKCPAFFTLTPDHQTGSHLGDYPQSSQKVTEKSVLEGSSAGHVFYASSPQTEENNSKDHKKMVDHENISTSTEGDGSMRWMSSKMRVKRKILPSSTNNHSDQINFSDHGNSSTDVVVRVCSDCNTTKTPLWRGGPQGPKHSSTRPSKLHKGKKLHTTYHDVTHSRQTTGNSKLSFEDFAMSLVNKKSAELFPGDEEEAAILLMTLSCSLISG